MANEVGAIEHSISAEHQKKTALEEEIARIAIQGEPSASFAESSKSAEEKEGKKERKRKKKEDQQRAIQKAAGTDIHFARTTFSKGTDSGGRKQAVRCLDSILGELTFHCCCYPNPATWLIESPRTTTNHTTI